MAYSLPYAISLATPDIKQFFYTKCVSFTMNSLDLFFFQHILSDIA